MRMKVYVLIMVGGFDEFALYITGREFEESDEGIARQI
jgi:hypothetical protein